jgi:glutathione peroxidase-family protein
MPGRLLSPRRPRLPAIVKSVVRPGHDQSPVIAFLTRSGNVPWWNFGAHLVGEDGAVIALLSSDVTPESPQPGRAIEQALATP